MVRHTSLKVNIIRNMHSLSIMIKFFLSHWIILFIQNVQLEIFSVFWITLDYFVEYCTNESILDWNSRYVSRTRTIHIEIRQFSFSTTFAIKVWMAIVSFQLCKLTVMCAWERLPKSNNAHCTGRLTVITVTESKSISSCYTQRRSVPVRHWDLFYV